MDVHLGQTCVVFSIDSTRDIWTIKWQNLSFPSSEINKLIHNSFSNLQFLKSKIQVQKSTEIVAINEKPNDFKAENSIMCLDSNITDNESGGFFMHYKKRVG